MVCAGLTMPGWLNAVWQTLQVFSVKRDNQISYTTQLTLKWPPSLRWQASWVISLSASLPCYVQTPKSLRLVAKAEV